VGQGAPPGEKPFTVGDLRDARDGINRFRRKSRASLPMWTCAGHSLRAAPFGPSPTSNVTLVALTQVGNALAVDSRSDGKKNTPGPHRP